MMNTIEQPQEVDIVSQESAPAVWETKKTDPLQIAKEAFAAWLKTIAGAEELFQKHVYQNEALHEADLRQHRSRLHALIAQGEKLAADFLILRGKEARSHVPFIDEQLANLHATLHEWHGPLDDQNDIPESFKEASREISEGKFEPFDPGALSKNA